MCNMMAPYKHYLLVTVTIDDDDDVKQIHLISYIVES